MPRVQVDLFVPADRKPRSRNRGFSHGEVFGPMLSRLHVVADVQSATQWTASVHTFHMPKPVITFAFKVLRNGLLRYILYSCAT